MKVSILINMIAPYRNSFFCELAKLVDLNVFFNQASESDRNWSVDGAKLGYKATILEDKGITYTRKRKDLEYSEKRTFYTSSGVFKALLNEKPDVIVSAEFGIRTMMAVAYGFLKKIPVLVWWEGTAHTEREVGFVKVLIRKLLCKRLAGAWTNGKSSKDYLIQLGMKSEGIQQGMTGIDTGDFRIKCEASMGTRDALRNELGLHHKTFLFSGSLSPRKGIRELLTALEELDSSLEEPIDFLFVGDGELRPDIEAFDKQSKNLNMVITGFIQPEDLPRHYVLGDAFILPTLDDNWPLVTLESTIAGLPQMISCYNGASANYKDRSDVCCIIDPLDTDQFVKQLALWAKDCPQRLSDDLISEYTEFYSGMGQAQRGQEICQSIIS